MSERSTKKSVLEGGDELFFAEPVLDFYHDVLDKWTFDSKEIALLLGCTREKPYSKSFMHKKIIGLLKKHDFEDNVQQYIIGEPLVVCPREWETKYPADSYNFPPNRLKEKGRTIFIERLATFFETAEKHYKKFVIFAPNHHRDIILEVGSNLIKPEIVPYNLYNLPKLSNVLEEVPDDGI